MRAREQALQAWSKYKGWTPAQAGRFNAFANGVAQVESNGKPGIAQIGGGPGRGKYQYELQAGGSGANITARNRLKKFQKTVDPTFQLSAADQKILDGRDPDFSKMSEDGQDAMFIVDKALSALPTDDVANGNLPPAEAWAKYHWAGDQSKKGEKIAQWDRSGAPQFMVDASPSSTFTRGQPQPLVADQNPGETGFPLQPLPVQPQGPEHTTSFGNALYGGDQEPAPAFHMNVPGQNQFSRNLGQYGQPQAAAKQISPEEDALLNMQINRLFATRPSAAQQLAEYGAPQQNRVATRRPNYV